MDDVPPHLRPFVLPVQAARQERHGQVDLYLPDANQPQPAILFVHGMPPPDRRPTPRDWPVFVGYGNAAAERNVIGAVVDHGLHEESAYLRAAGQVAAAADFVRQDPRVDPERIALWFFSFGGLMLADWLRDPPTWLRCVAATYPLLAPLEDSILGKRFEPAGAVARAGTLPIVLTRARLERPALAERVEAFLAAAAACAAAVEVIDVPNGGHGFDILDQTDESRDAVVRALDAVVQHLLGKS